MTLVHRLVCAVFAVAFLLVPPAFSSSFSLDQSDIWYIVSESGWGIQLVERGSVIFATIFVYGQTGAPTWYVATMDSNNGSTWTGDLYATTGPWFGTVPFDPANVVPRKAGTMTWTPQSLQAGTLTYVVDGVAVTKNVVRQTLVFDDYNGTYMGAFTLGTTNCTNPADNGAPFNVPLATITVTQNGQAVTVMFSIPGVSFTVSGTLTQSGQFGAVAGTYNSSVGEAGNATVSGMNVQTNSFTANYSLSSTTNGCQTSGYAAGIRALP